MHTFGHGVSCAPWRATVLHNLLAYATPSYTRQEIGNEALDELCAKGIFRSGLLPDDGDELLVHDKSGSRYCHVIRNAEEYFCYETHNGKGLTLKLPIEELRLFDLCRANLYRSVADDLGCKSRPTNLALGIWQIGTRLIPEKGNCLFIVVEPGVNPVDVFRIPELVQYKILGVLWIGERQALANAGSRIIFHGDLVAGEGAFHSTLISEIQDMEISDSFEAYIDLDGSPPKLVINKSAIPLPCTSSGPTDGVSYFDYLMQHPRTPIACWDLYLEIHPAIGSEVGTPKWNEDRLDETAKNQITDTLRRKRAELHQAEDDPGIPECERQLLRDDVASLGEHLRQDVGISGRSRQIGSGDREKARQKVRKALSALLLHIKKQDSSVWQALQSATLMNLAF